MSASVTSTVSLSKGLFVFKNSGKAGSFSKYKYWKQEQNCDDDIKATSFKNYQELWNITEKHVRDILNKTHSKVLKDLVEYVKKAGQLKYEYLSNNVLDKNKDIPVACLITGVNMPDHCMLFENLKSLVKENVSPYVCSLNSNDCATVKSAVSKLVSKLVNGSEVIFENSDSENDDMILNKTTKLKLVPRNRCNMNTLCAWYQNLNLNSQIKPPKIQLVASSNKISKSVSSNSLRSPSKKQRTTAYSSSPSKSLRSSKDLASSTKFNKSTTKNLKNVKISESDSDSIDEQNGNSIVVIIENVESVPINVLQDLVLIIREYNSYIPVAFVFGVSTTPSYLHQNFSEDASAAIAIETFQSQPSNQLLTEIIEELFMSENISFKIGEKVYTLLLEVFLFHDFSVNNFISRLKFCAFEHFTRGHASFLCCEMNKRSKILKKAKKNMIEVLRSTPSHVKSIEKMSVEEKNRLENDSEFLEYVEDELNNFENLYFFFCTLVKVLDCLTGDLPNAPLAKNARELFGLCLGQQVTDLETFPNSWKLLSMSSFDELVAKLEKAISILNGFQRDFSEATSLIEDLEVLLSRLRSIETDEIVTDESSDRNKVIELKPSDRFYLREKLLGSSKSKSCKKPYEQMKEEILKRFEHAFISHLKPINSKPFHEIFLFDSLGNVKLHVMGPVRATVLTALKNPHKYLQCKCCQQENNDLISKTQPDISICYKLHLESGQLINLYDWLESFSVVIGPDRNDTKKKQVVIPNKKNKSENFDKKLYARFIQCVSELQLLGFIKPTKRKTDHVQRLTWGSC